MLVDGLVPHLVGVPQHHGRVRIARQVEDLVNQLDLVRMPELDEFLAGRDLVEDRAHHRIALEILPADPVPHGLLGQPAQILVVVADGQFVQLPQDPLGVLQILIVVLLQIVRQVALRGQGMLAHVHVAEGRVVHPSARAVVPAPDAVRAVEGPAQTLGNGLAQLGRHGRVGGQVELVAMGNDESRGRVALHALFFTLQHQVVVGLQAGKGGAQDIDKIPAVQVQVVVAD